MFFAVYVVIADKVLRNELKGMVDNDPSLLADIEEICRHTGVLEAFQKTKKNGDPRYLLEAMKTSEAFHCELGLMQSKLCLFSSPTLGGVLISLVSVALLQS